MSKSPAEKALTQAILKHFLRKVKSRSGGFRKIVMPKERPIIRPNWLTETLEGTVIRIHVQPGASRSGIVGEYGEGLAARLKVRVASRPIDGAANDALIQLLGEVTGVSRRHIRIIRGATSRSKDILFEGLKAGDVLEKFATAT